MCACMCVNVYDEFFTFKDCLKLVNTHYYVSVHDDGLKSDVVLKVQIASSTRDT